MKFMRRLCLAACFAFHINTATAQDFPADAGFINVRDFGAKGDGAADDTTAINAALAASGGDTGSTFWQDKIVYFPKGIYLVSAPIAKRYANGNFGSGSILIGESRDGTVIKLKDHAAGYGDNEYTQAIIFTTAKLLDGNATGGGKDYTHKGEGNDAYMNFIEDLTVDAGAGNPGAIGIDYLANNEGAIRNVLVRGDGTTGIALTRKWPGPALLDHVRVEGFSTGIEADNTEYGVTMESVELKKQQHIGIQNKHNVLAIHNLTIEETPLPVTNIAPDGLIVIDGGTFSGNTGEAFHNSGYLNLRGITLKGYTTTLAASPIDGVFDGEEKISASKVSWSLPVKNPPPTHIDPVNSWVSVTKFGAKPDSKEDATAAIEKAFASGASTIYFPHGTYFISENIVVPPSVQRIVGMTSAIHAVKERDANFRYDQGFFRTQNTQHPLTIEHLAFDNSWLGDQTAVEAIGTQPLILRDVVGAGVMTLSRPASGGEAFIEDTCCGTISVAGPKGVWARQLNTEGPGTRITNSGAPLWILGIKTEQDCTVLDNSKGARTEVLGGLIYIPGRKPADPSISAFKNTDAKLLVSYAEESFDAASTYAVHVSDIEKNIIRNKTAESLPKRGVGRMVPELTAP